MRSRPWREAGPISRATGIFLALAAAELACTKSDNGAPAAPAPSLDAAKRVVFEDVARERGLIHTLLSGGAEKLSILENIGTGVAFLDVDSDGRLDVFVANAGEIRDGAAVAGPGSALFRQRNDGRFENVTVASGLVFDAWATGVAVADIEGDGDLDLFVGTPGRDLLFVNDGSGRFDEAGDSYGLGATGLSTSALFFDHDSDGYLDLWVVRYVDLTAGQPNGGEPCLERGVRVPCGPGLHAPLADLLYRSRSGRSFDDVSARAGISVTDGAYGLGVAAADFDGDGRLDVYVANDTTANFLWRATRDGRYEDIGIASGAGLSDEGQGQAGMGVAIGDVDDDGRPDVVVTNYSHEDNALYVNLGEGDFEERADAFGIGGGAAFRALGWGVLFLDVDSDGYDDLFIANGHVYMRAGEVDPSLDYLQRCLVYRRRPDSARFEAGEAVGRKAAYRSAAAGDFDRDGDDDVLLSVQDGNPVLLENRNTHGRRIALRLRASGPNREAIGARIACSVGARTVYRHVSRGGGYLGASDVVETLGLGDATGVDRIEVVWPNGAVTRFGPLAAGSLYSLSDEGVVAVERELAPPR